MRGEIRFHASIEGARGGGHVVEVDPDVAADIGLGHRSRVRGTFGGAPYRSNLVSMGGRLVLGVHRATLEAAGVGVGETVWITMTSDTQPLPTDEVPQILSDALARDAAAARAWQELPPSRRRRHVGSIAEAKKDETRRRRVERIVAMLRDGSEP